MNAEPGQQQSARDDALHIVKRLRQANYIAYFAGGCVRDLLLGKNPKDYDVATDAPPGRVRELFRNSQAVGAAFGVILVRHGATQIEVATFRNDGRYFDGRHPSEVRFSTAQEDARRRDFTINGLFLDPTSDEVIDYVGGQVDLRAGVIRAIGDPAERFEEDSLRLLRAVRFSARFSFPIETATARAIRSRAMQLRRISPERVADELRHMLSPATRARAWRMLWDLQLVHEIFRFLPIADAEPVGSGEFVFDSFAPNQAAPFGTALAAAALCYQMRMSPPPRNPLRLLARDRAAAVEHALRQSLRISNEESDMLRNTLVGLAPLLTERPPAVAAMKRFLAGATASPSLLLLDAIEAMGMHRDRIRVIKDRLAALRETEVAPEPLLDGTMLAAAGLRPGPLFKHLLETVYDAQLEDRVATREQALDLALRLASETNP